MNNGALLFVNKAFFASLKARLAFRRFEKILEKVNLKRGPIDRRSGLLAEPLRGLLTRTETRENSLRGNKMDVIYKSRRANKSRAGMLISLKNFAKRRKMHCFWSPQHKID